MLDRRRVVVTAGGCAVVRDGDIWMRLLKLRDLRVQHLEELRRATRVERRGARCDEGEADRGVRDEDMTVDDGIAALGALGLSAGAFL